MSSASEVITSDYTVVITPSPLSSQVVLDSIKSSTSGALIYFGGTTRLDGNVKHLEFESYVPMALNTLQSIAQGTISKFEGQVEKVWIGHRLGIVSVGEESVMVGVAAKHRKEGWAAAEWVLEEVKRRTEIWKKEVYQDGASVWKENR